MSEDRENLIRDWQQNFTARQLSPFWDKENFARRESYFAEEISLNKYQAFMAFAEVNGTLLIRTMSVQDRHHVLRHTLGTQYSDFEDAELEVVLDAYMDACQRIYDNEIEAALSGVVL